MQHPIPRSTTRPLAALLLLATFSASPWAQPVTPQPLNDTGITWSGHATGGNATTCDASHPAGQDCHYGRDKAAAGGMLTKTGGSTLNNGIANGFDYTKVCNSGELAGQGTCPADPALGAGPDEWACTKDNVTGLIWEVKTTSGLRNQNHTYTWFNTNSPDGNPGTSSGANASCETPGRCDTEKYVADVNASNSGAGLCGAADWRMPTVRELRSIADLGRTSLAAIDPTFFPNTPPSNVWSGSPYAGSSGNAWAVYFNGGYANGGSSRSDNGHVRLVRAGQ